VLSGTEFDLVIEHQPVNFTGKPRIATKINGSIPAPTLRWRVGDTVTIRVTNRLRETTSIHWHGIILPFEMDGVPGISFPGIAPGKTFTYRFKVQQTGTYWYHSHSGHQEQLGMYGAIVVENAASTASPAMRDHAIVLSDWTDENPERVFHKLKVHADYFNFNHPTVPLLLSDISEMGFDAAVNKRRMWNEMRMSPTDLADVSGYTYTYLMNGTTPAGNWTGLFSPGEKVRLRFINGAANSFYDVRIPGLKMTVVQTLQWMNCASGPARPLTPLFPRPTTLTRFLRSRWTEPALRAAHWRSARASARKFLKPIRSSGSPCAT
jgi:CopA family copper-resistance protein